MPLPAARREHGAAVQLVGNPPNRCRPGAAYVLHDQLEVGGAPRGVSTSSIKVN
jgi:hypothetical protein